MKLKITPEMEASMRATESRLDAAMDDPSFRAEHNEILSRYFVQELVDNLMTKASFARKAASYPTQRQVLVSVSFGAGSRPTFTIPTKRELAYA